jgi:MGT family glycosyltransferase
VDIQPVNDPVRDWEATNPLQALGILRDRLLFGPAQGVAEDTLAQIYRFRPDAMAIMDGTFGAMLAAERIGIPAAVVAPHILTYPVPGRPPFGPGLAPARNGLDRLRESLIRKLSAHVLGKGLDHYNAVRRMFRLDPLHDVFEQVSRMQRVLVMTSPALELPGGPLPGNVRYVGPALGDPAWAEPWESPWAADRKEPLVLVSFSTTFQNQAGVLRRVIDGLGALPVRALATVGPALQTETFRAPSNVVLRESAPHSQILPQAAAMITHAGHGSVVRALAHGVPLVCVPMGRDQNDIAARVAYHGAGVRLATTASAQRFTQAVEQVIGQPEFRARAERLGQAIRRDAESSTAVAELEALVPSETKAEAPSYRTTDFSSKVTA